MTVLISTEETARLLGVKPATVYAYVSRGLLTPAERHGGQGSWFSRDDIVDFRATHSRGHQPPAMRVDSGITLVEAIGPSYRGYDVLELATWASCEQVAALLWYGTIPDEVDLWEPREDWVAISRGAQRAMPADIAPLRRLQVVAASIGGHAGSDFDIPPQQVGPVLIASIVESLPGPRLRTPAPFATRMAAKLARTTRPDPAQVDLVRRSLVMVADHGFAASTTAARLAASYRADVHGIFGAGLSILGGGWQGAASTMVEPLFRSIVAGTPVAEIIAGPWSGEEPIPGLGQSLYPKGDPRFRALIRAIAEQRPGAAILDHIDRIVREVAAAGLPLPNVDAGLAAVTLAADLAPGSGEMLFAVGRMLGWIAHAMEAIQHKPVRLQSSYTGPSPTRGMGGPPQPSSTTTARGRTV